MEITFYGHACFALSQEKTKILIDPWLRQNPVIKEFPAGLKPNLILVTHGHGDHLGDAVEIAKAADCPILSTPEVVYHCSKSGAKTSAAHFGGTVRFDSGSGLAFLFDYGRRRPGLCRTPLRFYHQILSEEFLSCRGYLSLLGHEADR
jgi:L-ascorbate metabolism protein UlaG (beta-lactamase superfamily)